MALDDEIKKQLDSVVFDLQITANRCATPTFHRQKGEIHDAYARGCSYAIMQINEVFSTCYETELNILHAKMDYFPKLRKSEPVMKSD